MSDEEILVCARADALLTVDGAVFDRFCSRCRERVMIAPSGVRRLKQSSISIICLKCYGKMMRNEHPVVKRSELAAPASEITAEMLKTIPNPWRKRN